MNFKTILAIFGVSFCSIDLPAQTLQLTPSGYKYSEMTRMFENRIAYAFKSPSSLTPILFAWTSSGNSATLHWQRSDQYQETFKKRNEWIVLSDWAAVHESGAILNYLVSTKLAYVIIRGQWIDITNQFKGGPHPYALENIPDEDYQLYIQAELVQYINGVKSPHPNLFFQWYVNYGKPMSRPSLFYGNRIGIELSEHWIDSAGNDSKQKSTICQGIGLLCLGFPAGGTEPYGVYSFWNW